MKQTHKMKLDDEHFKKAKEGTKIIELRLFDKKRREIQLGDGIEFTNSLNEQAKIDAEVIGIINYNSFSELIDDFPISIFGFDSRETLKKQIYNY